MELSHLALNRTLGFGWHTTKVTSGDASDGLHDLDGFILGPAKDSRNQYSLHEVLYYCVTAKGNFLTCCPPLVAGTIADVSHPTLCLFKH